MTTCGRAKFGRERCLVSLVDPTVCLARSTTVAIFGKKQPDETVGNKPAASAGAKGAPAAAAAQVGKGEPRKEEAKAGDEAKAGGDAKASGEGSRLVVGSHVRLTGSEITDCDTVIVEGRVEATVDGRVMQITETGMFTGTVAIDMAEIRGQFNGELTVRKRLTVCGTGKVKGKIRYGTLVVEEGGELSGDVDSLGTAPGAAAGKPEAGAAAAAPAKPEASGLSPRGAFG
jgi:cytoskeletal protein CcmA (bactofilin family)